MTVGVCLGLGLFNLTEERVWDHVEINVRLVIRHHVDDIIEWRVANRVGDRVTMRVCEEGDR